MTVQVPVYIEHQAMTSIGIILTKVLARYEEHETSGKCLDCHGGY